MPTLKNSASRIPPTVPTPAPVSRLWRQLPAPVREPLLSLLSQILARQLSGAVSAKEDRHDQTEPNG